MDADEVAHTLILKGMPCYDHVLTTFGEEILSPNGEIDREKLAVLVFGSPERLSSLTQILHPEVIRQILEDLAKIESKSRDARVIVDASVMIESGFHRSFQYLIVVSCRPEQQLDRLLARSKLQEEQARQRIDSQIPLEKKIEFADWVVDNSGSRENTRQQVDSLWRTLNRDVWRLAT